MQRRLALFLVAFMGVSYAVVSQAQVIHGTIPAPHDTVNYGSGGGSSGNANYATTAGSANNANYATTAGNANNANNSTYASNANTANYASNANLANYATNAGSAVTATTASNANNANNAAYATNAGNAATATTATNATNAITAQNANNANNVVSGGSVNTGPLTATTGQFSGPLTSGTHTVNGNETVSGTLGVTGTTTLGALIATTINAASATLTGALNAASATISGALSAAGLTSSTTLNVTGTSTLGVLSAGASTFTGSTVNGNETVSGTTAANAVNANNMSIATGGVLNLPFGSKLTDNANGTFQLTTSTGTFGTLLLGGATNTTGVTLVPSNGGVNVLSGSGAVSVQLGAAVFKSLGSGYWNQNGGSATSTAYAGTAFTQGLYFPTATSLGLSTNGNNALTIDANQLSTFSGNVALSGTSPFFLLGTSSNGVGIKYVSNTVGAITAGSGGGTGILTGQFGAAGSAASPGFYAQASGNSGLYFPSGSTLGLTTNGTAALTIDSSQNTTLVHALETPTVLSYSTAQTLTAAQCGAQVFATGSTAFTITLPTSPPTGCPFVFTNNATATLTVSGGSATITGSTLLTGTSRTMGTAATSINTFEGIYNGTGWNIIRLVGTVN